MMSSLLVLLFVVCETLQPYLMADMIDKGVVTKDLSIIGSSGMKMIAVSLVGLFANVANVYLSSRVSIRFSTELRAMLFAKIQRLSLTDIDRFTTASLVTRLTMDISKIQHLVLLSMRVFLRAPLMLMMASFFVFSIHPKPGIIITIAISMLGVALFFLLKKTFPFYLRIQKKVDHLNNVVRENLINIRIVKSFVREDYELKKFDQRNVDLQETVVKASNVLICIYPMMQLVMNVSIVALLWMGNGLIQKGEMKVGELIAFLNYFAQILISLMLLSVTIMAYARASASSHRILQVMNTTSSMTEPSTVKQEGAEVSKGKIVFTNVSFKHVKATNEVLRKVNLTIEGGERVAIVGATGSAKSTLIHLIARLYDVSTGEITVDGLNVKDYPREELNRGVTVVPQVNELFTGTVAENLRWGKSDASLTEMIQMATVAEAHRFIADLPEGYDTLLGRDGVNLSGGQKQRICLTRALLRSPKILILDDSTSAVDTETEKRIFSNMKGMLADTTLIIVTQRAAVMNWADKIVVMDEGEVKAVGSFDELRMNSPLFAEIYNSQLLD